MIFQDNREPEESKDDETEENNQHTIAYLCRILADVFDGTDNEDDEFYHHQDNSVSPEQDYQLSQEYDVDVKDVKGDRLNVFILFTTKITFSNLNFHILAFCLRATILMISVSEQGLISFEEQSRILEEEYLRRCQFQKQVQLAETDD